MTPSNYTTPVVITQGRHKSKRGLICGRVQQFGPLGGRFRLLVHFPGVPYPGNYRIFPADNVCEVADAADLFGVTSCVS
jgi:hypothetical protein